MDRSLDRLKSILKQHIGLDASTVGDATIKKILNQRLRSCNITDEQDYYALLENNPHELNDLLETAVIPETWFFRDSKPFGIILQRLQHHLLKHPKQPFNILSIPCSTGEEPYSLAMFLMESAIPAPCFTITAVDISTNALQIARQGVYGENSFRGRTEQRYLDKYFSPQDNDLYRINGSIGDSIDFRQVNILDNKQLPCEKCFDIILCRNLLIYFDVDTKQVAFRNLHRILKDDGILFIGHSEFGAVPPSLFTSTCIDNVFGLVKPTAQPEKTITAPVKQQSKSPPQKSARRKTTENRPQRAFASHESTRPLPADQPDQRQDIGKDPLLREARQLADEGSFKSAEELCIQHMDECGDSAEGFFLLGLIRQARDDVSNAEQLFRKALFLEPRHYESLVYLALIVEQSGDTDAAALLRQRAQRASEDG